MSFKHVFTTMLAGVLSMSGLALGQQTRPADEMQNRLQQKLDEAVRRARDGERRSRETAARAQDRVEEKMRNALAQAEDRMHDLHERFGIPVDPTTGEPVRREGGWLGLELTPVPAAVAAQLGAKPETGIMIRNIFTESPADKAGLQRYDVITGLDGQPVTNMRDFGKRVQDKKPGSSATLTLYRGGQKTDVTLNVAEMPERMLDRKYGEDPDVQLQRQFDLRGRIFRPGPHGGWTMEDLGAMPELRRFFVAPGAHRRTTTQPEGDQARRVDREGRSLQVTRRPDGTIEVHRETAGRGRSGPGTTPPAMSETRVYKDAEALKQADPDAADLLKSMGEPTTEGSRPPEVPRTPQPPPLWPGQRPPATPPPPLRPMPPVPPQVPDTQPAGPHGDRRELRPPQPQRLPLPPRPDRGKAWEGPVPRPGDERWQEFMDRFVQGPMKDVLVPAPAVRFDVQADGSIAVHKRTRDAELNMTFRNRQELQQQAPELYKQFEDLQRDLMR